MTWKRTGFKTLFDYKASLHWKCRGRSPETIKGKHYSKGVKKNLVPGCMGKQFAPKSMNTKFWKTKIHIDVCNMIHTIRTFFSVFSFSISSFMTLLSSESCLKY